MSIAVRSSLFFLIAGSKTLVNIGQACLTVESAVLAVNCLAQYHDASVEYSDRAQSINVFFQTTAAIFSTLLVVLTRYPAIWDKLSLEKLRKQFQALHDEVSDSPRKTKALLALIGLFGFLSCIARGMSAYLFTEVLLGDRFNANATAVKAIGWLAASTVILSTMSFNLSNMLKNATKFLKNLTLSFRWDVLVSLIATISTAVAMRFFIMTFFDRRGSSFAAQIIGQTVFTVAEFVLGLFTMVSSFETGWQKKAKQSLKSSYFLTFIMLGDSVTAWLGYSAPTWYSILTNVFLGEKTATLESINACVANTSNMNFSLRWTFFGLAVAVGVPTTFAYIHYLLAYAKGGYDRSVDLTKLLYHYGRYGFFKPEERRHFHDLPRDEDLPKTYPLIAYTFS